MPQFIPDGKFLESMRPLIAATDGLTLSQVCSITELEPSTIQNWVKRGFVARPVNKKYRERQIARILLISFLRDSMKLESIGVLMKYINGSANDESDDIISEEELLKHFCGVITRVKKTSVSENDIDKIITDEIADYVPRSGDSYTRLAGALKVMSYAYIASDFKSKAENSFSSLMIIDK